MLAAIAVSWLGLVIWQGPETRSALVCGRDVTPGADTVVMLSASWCGYCRRARAYLHGAGIEHCEYDVETNAEGRRQFDALTVKVVPVIRIRDDVLFGFNRTEIEQSMMAHGLLPFEERD